MVVMPLTSRTHIPYFHLTQAHTCRPGYNSSALFPAVPFRPPETWHILAGCGHRGGRGARSTAAGEEHSDRNVKSGPGRKIPLCLTCLLECHPPATLLGAVARSALTTCFQKQVLSPQRLPKAGQLFSHLSQFTELRGNTLMCTLPGEDIPANPHSLPPS